MDIIFLFYSVGYVKITFVLNFYISYSKNIRYNDSDIIYGMQIY